MAWTSYLPDSPERLSTIEGWLYFAIFLFGVLTAVSGYVAVQVRGYRASLEKKELEKQLTKSEQDLLGTRLELDEARKSAEEAQNRVKTLEEQARPRTLTEQQKTEISDFLTTQPKGRFTIKANVTAFDARRYAEEIANLFRNAGWTVKVDSAIITGPDISGLWISVKDSQKVPGAAGILQHAFAAVGISVRAQIDSALSDADEVWLSIGNK